MATGYNLPGKLSLNGNLSENFKKFNQSFIIYLEAAGLAEATEGRKIAIFLNLIGEDALNVYNTLKTEDLKTLKGVQEMLEKFCNPKKNVLHSRYIFYNRSQKPGECFDNFLTDLKRMSNDCEFLKGKDEALRDRLVFGSSDLDCQKKMIKKGDPTLEEVIDAFRVAELTNSHLKEIQINEVDALTVNKEQMNKKRCSHCGTTHPYGQCPAWSKTCVKCKKKNHFARMCRTNKSTNEVTIAQDSDYYIETVTCKLSVDSLAWYQEVTLPGQNKVSFKLDPGANVNIMPVHLYEKINSTHPIVLTDTCAKLESWNGFKTPIKGLATMNIQVNDKLYTETFCVAGNENSMPILCRDACVRLNLVKRIASVVTNNKLNKEDLIKENSDLFTGIGKFSKQYDIKLKKDTIPTSKPPYRLPLKLRPKLEEELIRLEGLGIISKVNEPSEWVNRLVIIEKPDKSIRICLDPKDLNNSIVKDYGYIPTVQDLSTKLKKSKYFSVLDLKYSFWHIVLSEKSSKYCTFATMFGTYKFNRLPFGISIASEVFQKMLSEIFGSIDGVVNYIDDILCYAETEEQMNTILSQVFEKAREYNIRFNKNKFQYMLNQVKYLGQIFENGTVRPDTDSVKAITEYDIPKNKNDLQRLLGLINYLRSYIPNVATITSPLRDLLKKDTVFDWQKIHTDSFEKIKTILSTHPVLHTFDPNKDITIQTDSSKTGIGCVLLQENKPIYYASKSLTETEINYGQIEKEFLAVLFSCKKFHTFIYGKQIVIQTDHLPLISIMKKSLCDIPSTRLQRIKLKLSIYNITLKHVPGTQMHIADALSRACSTASVHQDCDSDLNEIVHTVNVSDDILSQIKQELCKDPIAANLIKFHKNGWPNSHSKIPAELKYLYNLKTLISLEDDLIFINNRLYIPESLQDLMLKKLHECHFGITKSKARAKTLFYWNNMNSDIEKYITNCKVCKKYSNNNIKEPMIIRVQPELPFQYVSIDILQYGSNDYLTLVDHYSKWIELHKLTSKTADATITILKAIFSTHGIPEIIYSDNMPFNSLAFLEFSKEWQFKPIYSSPHYHQSNGAAERAVAICKNFLKKSNETKTDIEQFLLEYRNSPVVGLNLSPTQLLFNRLCRTKLPVKNTLLKPKLNPEIKNILAENALKNKQYYDQHTRPRTDIFKEGQKVVFKENEHSNIWKPATIIKINENPRSVTIKDNMGNLKTRNTWFIKADQGQDLYYIYRIINGSMNTQSLWSQVATPEQLSVQPTSATPPVQLRRSNREVRPPSYLMDYVTDINN